MKPYELKISDLAQRYGFETVKEAIMQIWTEGTPALTQDVMTQSYDLETMKEG